RAPFGRVPEHKSWCKRRQRAPGHAMRDATDRADRATAVCARRHVPKLVARTRAQHTQKPENRRSIQSPAVPSHDVLIIGAGLAGQRAALAAAQTGAFGGASAARTYYVADITGQAILHVLYEQLLKHHEQLDRYEEWFTVDLLQDDDGHCTGAICRNLRDGHLEVFNAKAVILASGGAGQVYQPTTNGLIVTGDGIAQAYRIGARLQDMEMVQYHPTTLAGNGLLITEGARGEGAWLLHAEGERVMARYAPTKLELASRHVVSRAEQTEINEGRGFPDGTVALDSTKVPRRRTLEALREIVNIGRDYAGVDITREPIHIRPGNHYIMGG